MASWASGDSALHPAIPAIPHIPSIIASGRARRSAIWDGTPSPALGGMILWGGDGVSALLNALDLQIHGTLHKVDGAAFNLLKNAPHIFAEQPDRENLHAGKKQRRNHERGPAEGVVRVVAQQRGIRQILQQHHKSAEKGCHADA